MKWPRKKNNQPIATSLEQERAEKLTQLGAQLLASREAKNLSLEEVVILTRIPRRLLQAIEQGNLNDLPEPVYIQGLIRQFADALGFNGAEFASTFPITSSQMNGQLTGGTSFLGQLRPIHLYLLYIFIIICSVNGLSQLLNNATLQANNSQSEPSPQKDSIVKSQPTQPKHSSIQSVSTVKEVQPVQIGVTLKASSWIRVVADGKTQFEGTLPQGTHRIWQAQEQLTVKTNNAGGVLMSVNQQEAKEMGEPGKEEEIMIGSKPQS